MGRGAATGSPCVAGGHLLRDEACCYTNLVASQVLKHMLCALSVAHNKGGGLQEYSQTRAGHTGQVH